MASGVHFNSTALMTAKGPNQIHCILVHPPSIESSTDVVNALSESGQRCAVLQRLKSFRRWWVKALRDQHTDCRNLECSCYPPVSVVQDEVPVILVPPGVPDPDVGCASSTQGKPFGRAGAESLLQRCGFPRIGTKTQYKQCFDGKARSVSCGTGESCLNAAKAYIVVV